MNHQLYFEFHEHYLLFFIIKTKKKFPGKSVVFMQDEAKYPWHKNAKKKKIVFGSRY